MHIHVLFGHIQPYCGIFRTLCNSCIFRILAYLELEIYRSSRPEVFCKKGVLRNSTKFTGKHLCQRLFFNKVAGLRHRCFPVNFVEFLRTPFFIEHLWWLLLDISRTVSKHILAYSQCCVTLAY